MDECDGILTAIEMHHLAPLGEKWGKGNAAAAGVGGGGRTDRPPCSFPSVFFPHYAMQIKPALLIPILRVLKSLAAADVLHAVYPASRGDYTREPCGKKEYQENGERKHSWKVGSVEHKKQTFAIT